MTTRRHDDHISSQSVPSPRTVGPSVRGFMLCIAAVAVLPPVLLLLSLIFRQLLLRKILITHNRILSCKLLKHPSLVLCPKIPIIQSCRFFPIPTLLWLALALEDVAVLVTPHIADTENVLLEMKVAWVVSG